MAILGGMRPGEILALTWECLTGHCAEIRQRLYRGKVDVPKTRNSVRKVALSEGLLAEIESWRAVSIDINPKAWVFASENGKTPVTRDKTNYFLFKHMPSFHVKHAPKRIHMP